jgi:hypothetical protein
VHRALHGARRARSHRGAVRRRVDARRHAAPLLASGGRCRRNAALPRRRHAADRLCHEQRAREAAHSSRRQLRFAAPRDVAAGAQQQSESADRRVARRHSRRSLAAAGGGPLLRSVSSTTLRTKPSGGSPSLIKSASTDDAVARDDELRGALVFSSTSLTTSERECWRCHTWLAGDVVSAAGRHFHTDCFQCDECHASLLATLLRFAFDEASDQRLCHACFIRRPAAAVVVAAAADVSPTVVVAAEPAPVVARVRQQQLGMHRTSFTLKSEQE